MDSNELIKYFSYILALKSKIVKADYTIYDLSRWLSDLEHL